MTTTTTLPFAGGEMGSFEPLDNGSVEITTSGRYDSTLSRCAIIANQSSAGFQTPTWSAASTFWLHAMVYPGGYVSTRNWVRWYNGSTEVARVASTGSNSTVTLYTLQGGVLTSVGTFTPPSTTLNLMDIALVSNTASGSASVYLAGTLVLSATGLNHSGWTGVTQVRFCGSDTASYWSQIICDTIPHVGGAVYTLNLNTNSGTNTGWTGDVSNIDEVVYNDATFNYATANGQISTYSSSSASLTGYYIRGIAVGVRALCGATGPQNIKLAIRTGGANYLSPTSIALNSGYQACTYCWTTNPGTSIAWTASDAAAVEGGMEALT